MLFGSRVRVTQPLLRNSTKLGTRLREQPLSYICEWYFFLSGYDSDTDDTFAFYPRALRPTGRARQKQQWITQWFVACVKCGHKARSPRIGVTRECKYLSRKVRGILKNGCGDFRRRRQFPQNRFVCCPVYRTETYLCVIDIVVIPYDLVYCALVRVHS